MGLFTGAAPPDVTKTQTTASTTPDYYTDYLTKLSQSGQSALGTYDPTTKQFTAPTQASMIAAGSPYVAPLTQLQQDVFKAAPTGLTRYQTPMDEALAAGKKGAPEFAQYMRGQASPEQLLDDVRRGLTNMQKN